MEINLNKICVVGAGNMGSQISLLCALNGFPTRCSGLTPESLNKADAFVTNYLEGRVEKGKLKKEEAEEIHSRILFTQDLKQACENADFVIEAVTEILDVKRGVFADLDRFCAPHTILATNSSYIVSSLIADVTARQDKVLNMHFFNPVLPMKLVEVVQGPHVSQHSADVTMEFSSRLGRIPVLLKKEIEGFLLNSILRSITREALWLLEMGIASPEDIDKACVYGAGHPMGPFRRMDLTGIDLAYTTHMERFKNTGDWNLLPPPSLAEHYTKGEFGEKSGKGWYDYRKKK
jgi:3-hydroxybutyryl-CoA dehydrogenase